MGTDDIQERAIAYGKENRRIARLVQNWCSHLQLSVNQSMLGEMTNLPIGSQKIRCPHARAFSVEHIDLRFVALNFYDRNCHDCDQRAPVAIPNLSQLVTERDTAVEVQEEKTERRARRLDEQKSKRNSERNTLRISANPETRSFLDLIEKFDTSGSNTDGTILIDAIRAASDKIEEPVEAALFGLANAEGRQQIALSALSEFSDDEKRLTRCAMKALSTTSCGVSIADSLVERGLAKEHSDLVEGALPTLIYHAVPKRELGQSVKGIPGGLLAVYRLFPSQVLNEIASMLRARKESRIIAAKAVQTILEEDFNFLYQMANRLIRSLDLTDNGSGEGSAAGHIANCFAYGLRRKPEAVDRIIGEAMARSSDDTRAKLIKVYNIVLEPLEHVEWGTPLQPDTVNQLAIGRLIEALAQDSGTETLQSATDALHRHDSRIGAIVARRINAAIGAAVLLSEKLEKPLIMPPDYLGQLEAENYHTGLYRALCALKEVIGEACIAAPVECGTAVLETLESLDDSQEMLGAQLVETLGELMQRPAGLGPGLKALYGAMMRRSVRVRAAAATAYGKLDSVQDSLPSLIHESFVMLLRDSHTLIHQSAVNAISRYNPPTGHRTDARDTLYSWLVTYAQTPKNNEDFLIRCLEKFFLLSREIGDVSKAQLASVGMRVLRGISPRYAETAAVRYANIFCLSPHYPHLLLDILEDSQTLEHQEDEIVYALAHLKDTAIKTIVMRLPKTDAESHKRGGKLTYQLLELAYRVRAWSVAEELAEAYESRFDESLYQNRLRLRGKAIKTAAVLEAAASSGSLNIVLRNAEMWVEVCSEIEKDDEKYTQTNNPS